MSDTNPVSSYWDFYPSDSCHTGIWSKDEEMEMSDGIPSQLEFCGKFKDFKFSAYQGTNSILKTVLKIFHSILIVIYLISMNLIETMC